MPLVILHHLLNVFLQLANNRGFTKKILCDEVTEQEAAFITQVVGKNLTFLFCVIHLFKHGLYIFCVLYDLM
jgi:hypothetical protein